MKNFSIGRFAVLLLVLAIGVGIGAGLERLFRVVPIVVRGSAPAAPAAVPAPAAPQTQAAQPSIECSATASFGNNLYPSLMLSLGSAYPEYLRCLTIAVRHAKPGRSCRVSVDSSLLQAPLVVTTDAPSEDFDLNPDIPWNYNVLRRVDQLRPETLVVSVSYGDRIAAQAALTCLVHPVNEAVARVLNRETGMWQDTSVCFAAFVNEEHPWIGGLLQDALAAREVERFTGYGSGSQAVEPQLKAIWNAVAARGLSYVDLATTSGSASGVATQYVRFVEESIHEQGANCVDASVLLASIFRRIGLRPVLLFKPGHCFVAVYDSAQGGKLISLETTLLGSAPYSAGRVEGDKAMASTAPNLDSPGYSLVDIALARQAGVKPIEYIGNP